MAHADDAEIQADHSYGGYAVSDIYGDIATIKTKADALAVEKVANFGYTDLAYSSDQAAGVTDFDFARDQNVPNKASTDFNSVVLDK